MTNNDLREDRGPRMGGTAKHGSSGMFWRGANDVWGGPNGILGGANKLKLSNKFIIS